MSVYKGSIAQKNVQFPIETVVTPINGENFARGMVFIPVSLAETYLSGVTSPAAGNLYELSGSNYAALAGGQLKNVLVPFFTAASAAKFGVAVYDDGSEAETNLIADVYEKFKYYAYFKFAMAGAGDINDLQVTLTGLCNTDPACSAHWIGTSDTNVLTSTSALITALNTAGSNARVIYNPDTTIDPAIAQLGNTLAVVNDTGTPVGNSVDMAQFNTIKASGALNADGGRENLTALNIQALDGQKIGYQTWVGDGTENVVTEGSLTLKGDSVGANWVKAYIEYMCKVQTATYISQRNTFRNNDTYAGIKLILANQVAQFINTGRLADFQITAPAFRDLPASGDTITVPNAWHATYIDDVREVTVYGTLYITKATR